MEVIIKSCFLLPNIKKEEVLERKNLLSLLEGNLDKKLILITGGAGCGKTTLVVQLIKKVKMKYMFFSIPERRTWNPLLLVEYLIEGFKSLHPKIGKISLDLSKKLSSSEKDIELICGALVNELIERVKEECLIVLDNYEQIEKNEPSNDIISFLLQFLPPYFHIIIVSRTYPPLKILPKLKVKGEIFELDSEDLMFTNKEINFLITKIWKLQLPSQTVKKILFSFKGWIAPISLLRYLFQYNPHYKWERHKTDILNYLQYEIFLHLPKEVQKFLIQISVLEEITSEICEYLKEGGSKILKLSYHQNLPISMLEENIYNFHPLFQEFLVKKLTKEGFQKVCNKVGEYYVNKENYEKAILYFNKAGNKKKIVKLIEKIGFTLIKEKRFSQLEEWLNYISKKEIENHPSFLYFKGEIAKYFRNLEKSLLFFRRAEELCKSTTLLYQILYGKLSVLRFQGKYETVVKEGEKLLKKIPQPELMLRVKVLNEVGVSYLFLHDFPKSEKTLKLAEKLVKKTQNIEGIHPVKANLMALYIENNEFDKAVEIGLELVKRGEISYYMGIIYQRLGNIYMIKGKLDEATNFLNKSADLLRKYNLQTELAETLIYQGELHLLKEEYLLSRTYIEEAFNLNKSIGLKFIENEGKDIITWSYLLEGNLIAAERWNKQLLTFLNEEEKLPYLFTKGVIELKFLNLEEARKCFELYIHNVPKNTIQFMLGKAGLGNVYYLQGKEKLALESMSEALKIGKRYEAEILLIKEVQVNKYLLKKLEREEGTEEEIRNYVQHLIKIMNQKYDLMVSMFGGLNIKRKEPIQEMKWTRLLSKSVFCYLLLYKKKVFSIHKLVEIFFPQGGKFSLNKKKLYQAITTLRTQLKFNKKDDPIIEYREGGYSINKNYLIWLDVEEFFTLIHQGEMVERQGKKEIAKVKYKEALTLYRGKLLPEIEDIWVYSEREFYEKEYSKVKQKLEVI